MAGGGGGGRGQGAASGGFFFFLSFFLDFSWFHFLSFFFFLFHFWFREGRTDDNDAALSSIFHFPTHTVCWFTEFLLLFFFGSFSRSYRCISFPSIWVFRGNWIFFFGVTFFFYRVLLGFSLPEYSVVTIGLYWVLLRNFDLLRQPLKSFVIFRVLPSFYRVSVSPSIPGCRFGFTGFYRVLLGS